MDHFPNTQSIMKNSKNTLISFLKLSLTCLFISTTCYAEKEYAQDYEKALEAAAKSKKNTFILFTNSKSCIPCKKFKADIFSKEAFEKYAEKELILVRVDYAPCFAKEDKKTLVEVEGSFKLPQKIAHRGRGPWPYLIVLSPEGKQVFSGVAYDKGRTDVKSFLNFLKAM